MLWFGFFPSIFIISGAMGLWSWHFWAMGFWSYLYFKAIFDFSNITAILQQTA